MPRSNLPRDAQRQKTSGGFQTTTRRIASSPEGDSNTLESDDLLNVQQRGG
jgi:hypothetical protein